MPDQPRRLVIAITGATGAVYGVRLLQHLQHTPGVETHLVVSEAAVLTLRQETGLQRREVESYAHVVHKVRDIGAAIASGSFQSDGMIVAPCSMKTLASVAHASTVPSVLHEIRLMLEQYWPSAQHVLIEPGVRTGIPLLVDNPKEVGADRIVNCLAAFHKFGTPAIVVDFGSSICVDVVSAKGEFLGGAIAPGVQVSSDAAAARSAALRRVELTRPRSVVG
jgi:pantothenate kinase type III